MFLNIYFTKPLLGQSLTVSSVKQFAQDLIPFDSTNKEPYTASLSNPTISKFEKLVKNFNPAAIF